MNRVISTEKSPIKMWLPWMEDGAEKQAKNVANLPFVFKHVAIMPDAHQGYGCPIGGVVALDGVVSPNLVGVDIGCGMCAIKTAVTTDSLNVDQLKAIMGLIRERVPVGKQHHEELQHSLFMPHGDSDVKVQSLSIAGREMIAVQQYNRARYQVGTLGGGNHFIEIQHDADKNVWIMIHSGSRNLGKRVADHYNKIAKDLNAKWKSEVPPSVDLAFLPIDCPEGQDYIAEMNYCVDFALENRKLMMRRCLESFYEIVQQPLTDDWQRDLLNIAHNYATIENHFGRNVWVHRKGATKATLGGLGIIPGSQGTKSYIVKGKGNRDSFNSCSHGAGRALGRADARRKLNLADEIARLDAAGVVHGIRNEQDLDEAAGAYKDITEVMANQADLVEIVTELSPMGVIKG